MLVIDQGSEEGSEGKRIKEGMMSEGRDELYLVCQCGSGWQFHAESLGELCFYTSNSSASLVLLADGQGNVKLGSE
jgi:hypothetical protein